jgi:gamma-glutamyltranspeptidase/glutathione hydrolase
MRRVRTPWPALILLLPCLGATGTVAAQEPKSAIKPVLHGSHWMAIAGKPLAATAGALNFFCVVIGVV